jgi:hypothetical protein
MDCYPNHLATEDQVSDGPRCADCTSYPLSFHDHVKFCRTVMDTVSFFTPACDKQAERARPPSIEVEQLKVHQARKDLMRLDRKLQEGRRRAQAMDAERKRRAAYGADLEAFRSGEHDKLLTHTHKGTIYFVRCGNFVKIGYTTTPVKQRILGLMTGNPFNLTVIGMCPGTFATERWLHKNMREFHHRMEWFRMEERFLRRIRRVIAQSGGSFFAEKARREPLSTPV